MELDALPARCQYCQIRNPGEIATCVECGAALDHPPTTETPD